MINLLAADDALIAQRPERRPEFLSEHLGLLPRREVAALVGLVEVDQVAIGAPGPGFGSLVIFVRKYGDGHRELDFVGLLGGRKNNRSSAILPVQPRG
jgi:hypothetical protein